MKLGSLTLNTVPILLQNRSEMENKNAVEIVFLLD